MRVQKPFDINGFRETADYKKGQIKLQILQGQQPDGGSDRGVRRGG